MATYTTDKIEFGGNVYKLQDSDALPLAGGNVTGPVNFGDSVTMEEASVGDIVITGNASTTNNLQVNTINGVAVGTTPKFTDTVTTVSTTGSGNAVTAISASNGALTATKGTTFLTSHQDISGKADKSATVSTVVWDSTNKKLTKIINGTTSDVVTAATLRTGLNVADGAEVNQNAFSSIMGFTGLTPFAPDSENASISAQAKTSTAYIHAGNNINITDYIGFTTNPSTEVSGIQISAKDTTYESKTAASGGTDVSLVTTGEKYTWNNKLSSHQTIKQDGVTGATVNRFGACSTAAATAAKTVSITTGTFTLETGAKVTVKFTNKNTANSPTLNVNSTGAKNIYHNGAQITSGTNKGMLYGTVEFVYDGTQWQLIGNYVDTNTAQNQNAFSNVKVGSTTIAADTTTDTIELVAGDNITLTPDTTNDKVTIAATQAVTSVAGKTGAVTLSKSDVGLNNVDNTADANKHVLTAKYMADGLVIDGLFVDGGSEDNMDTNGHVTHYCVCSTAAATAAKVATTDGNLNRRSTPGTFAIVKFTNTNTAAVEDLTLKIGVYAALPIKYRGGNLPSAGILAAGRIYLFVHDGTNWELVGDLDPFVTTATEITANKPVTIEGDLRISTTDGDFWFNTSAPYYIKGQEARLTSTDNLNDYTDVYYMSAWCDTVQNRPSTAGTRGRVVCNMYFQTYYEQTSDNQILTYTRGYISNQWTKWKCHSLWIVNQKNCVMNDYGCYNTGLNHTQYIVTSAYSATTNGDYSAIFVPFVAWNTWWVMGYNWASSQAYTPTLKNSNWGSRPITLTVLPTPNN